MRAEYSAFTSATQSSKTINTKGYSTKPKLSNQMKYLSKSQKTNPAMLITKRTINIDQNTIIIILLDIILTNICERIYVVVANFRLYRPNDIITNWKEKSIKSGKVR